MANTTSLNYHIIFSTKERQPCLGENVRKRLFAYLGGIARENRMKALEIGGAADHLHMLVSIPAPLAVSKAIQLIKGGSSHWLKETFAGMKNFAWQDGYAAFTVSQSQLDDVREYVRNQAEHHRAKPLRRNIVHSSSVIVWNMMNAICWDDFSHRYATPRL